MTELITKIFDGHDVRITDRNSDPWFILKDVCDILGLKNPTMVADTLDDDERSKFNLGRQGETIIVNEYGLYSIVLRSRKPDAKRFKRWITHDVIPSIRKTGKYDIRDIMPEIQREAAKLTNKSLRDSVQQYLEPVSGTWTYKNISDLVNSITTGCTAKKYREIYGLKKHESIRDHMKIHNPELLKIIASVETVAKGLIDAGKDYNAIKDDLTVVFGKKEVSGADDLEKRSA